MTKIAPFRLANPFDPTDGDWYWITTDTYGGPGGADGDGGDDRAAIQAVITAAASASKGVYVPAGTYRINPSGGLGLDIPSNITIRGVGATSVLELYDDGTDDRNYLLALPNRSNVRVKDLKLTGTQTDKEASVQLIGLGMTGAGCHTINVDGVTFDKGEYAVRCVYDSGTVSSGLTVTGCTTLSNVLNPFYLAYIEDAYISGCDLNANSVDCMPDRYPHHFYMNDGCDGIYVSGCILRNGQHLSVDAHSDGGTMPTNIYFTGIEFENVLACIYGNIVGTYHFDDITMSSNCYEYDYSMCNLTNVTDFEITNFTLASTAGQATYLTEMTNNTSVVFGDGTMTNCEGYLGATPKGANVTGTAPVYDNVVINTPPAINYGV